MKRILFAALSLLAFCTVAFSQAGTKLMLDMDSSFAKLDVPIYEGVDEFQAKLDKIREEKGREPLGLVMCGGSARAFAHIGALKAMEENGVTPDFIIANSMGAIIGMFYAYGLSPDAIQEVISNISLTQYFEPVMPLHGGILSVRKYRAFVNDLLGKPHTDLSECPIPILVLTEDLYTKRQIYHCSGDFANIMTASFAMSAIMEPTKMNLNEENNNTPVCLIDSGSIDIAGLTVAERFSSNIIVSTALYDTELNYNNMIVVLNRTMSIGKERIASRDIKKFMPVIIRNNVEHFSFMAFDKADELAEIGYESAQSVMDDILKCPHGMTDLTERRKLTDKFASDTIRHVHTNETLEFDEKYFGAKIWPMFPVVDFPEYTLYDTLGISAYGFMDTSKFYGRLGVTVPFDFTEISADALLRYNPSSVFGMELFGSYSFSLNGFKPQGLFAAASVKLRPEFFPYAFKSIFLTGEYISDPLFKPMESLFKLGLDIEAKNANKASVVFKPFYFVSGQDFTALSNGAGVYMESDINTALFSKKQPRFAAGLSENFSARHAFFNFKKDSKPETNLYISDFFRSNIPLERNNYVISNSVELYFTDFDPGFTFAELIILQQYKAGGFFDFSYSGYNNFCAGAFGRAQISIIGLCNFIFEGGCGWNFTDSNVFGYFVMKNRI